MKTLCTGVAATSLAAAVALCGCQGAQSSPVAPFSAPTATDRTSAPVTTVTPIAVPSATASAGAGGVVNISVPTPSPVLCSPSPLIVRVGSIGIAACSAAGYAGPIEFSVADSSIAMVSLAPQFSATYFVTGVTLGTTSLDLQYVTGGSGSLTIAVTP